MTRRADQVPGRDDTRSSATQCPLLATATANTSPSSSLSARSQMSTLTPSSPLSALGLAPSQLPPADLSATVTQLRRWHCQRQRRIALQLTVISLFALGACLLFATYGILDIWELVGPIRLKRLAALTVVAVALSCSTVVFQAVTRNRILSPSVMGFDAMFSLTATASVFFFTSAVVNRTSPTIIFLGQAGAMTMLAVTLFMTMLRRGRNNVHLLVLVGIVVGTLLRSLTSMMSLILDPNEFLNVQDRGMASFAVTNTPALAVTVAVTVIVVGLMAWQAKTLDIVALGPDLSTALGINYRREVRWALALAAVLVACATALVGPLMFFGLLIVNVTVFALKSAKTRDVLWGSAAIGVLVLVGGQGLLEHLFARATVLPVVIELLGGALLLIMIVKEARR